MLLVATLVSLFWFNESAPMRFRSAESLTLNGDPVFNEIKFIEQDNKDIWMMRQSHQGLGLAIHRWDRLAIVVDRSDKTVKYYQLKPGKLTWSENEAEVPLKVSCFMCHSNGPRLIRPNQDWHLSPLQKAQVLAMNLRIKTYGPLTTVDHTRPGATPLRLQGKMENSQLKLALCQECHNRDSIFGRGELTRQNAVTISYLIENEHMPPIGSLSSKEKQYLKYFIMGLN
jgi:hypothetical protein